MEYIKPFIGMVAATCTTVAFIPQVVHIIRTKETKNISLSMYVIFTTGVLMWLLYGILNEDLPIILANSVTLLLAVTILYLKIKHG